jgi:5-methylcytosine-specific restriction endonuclease McrA
MDAKYKAYLKSDEWAQLKIDLFTLRGRSCEKCSSKTSLSVHHLTYDNIFNEEPEDLIILCGKCHDKEHGIIKVVRKKSKGNKQKNFKILSLAQKVELKKRNPKKYKAYMKLIAGKTRYI